MAEIDSPGIIAVGASAGGVEALTAFVTHLPADLNYAVLVTLHMPASANSALAHILDRAGPLQAVAAGDGMRLEPGMIYTSRPGFHLLTGDGIALLTDGPSENGHRPSINALFRSVAVSVGSRGVGVLLSGVGDDGVDGLAAITAYGGITIAQHPADALYSTLPSRAIDTIGVDYVLPATQIGRTLAEVGSRHEVRRTVSRSDAKLEQENRIAMSSRFERRPTADDLGSPSGYVCPDCGGALIAVDDEHRYRCHIGHAWTGSALLDAQHQKIDTALSVALRSLHERIRLADALAGKTKPGALHDRYRRTAREAEHAAETLSAALTQQPIISDPAPVRSR